MKYALIIEENQSAFTQTVEEVNNMDEVLDNILFYTNYFTPEDDAMCEEIIGNRDFDNLARAIAYCNCNQEPATTYGKKYCEILNDIKNAKEISEMYSILPKLNQLLKDNGIKTEIFLNELTEKEYYGDERY